MSAKERILTIRLMEKVDANPAVADRLGIVVGSGSVIEGERYGTNKKP